MKLRVRHSPNNQTPHSLQEQRYVLSKEQIAVLLPALESSVFTGAGDVEEGIAAEDWGILYTDAAQAVHPVVSKIVHHIATNNEYLKTHSLQGRPVLRRVAVVKMDSSPPSPARSRFQPQHHWHKDGGTSLITVVFTLYNGEWDSSNSPGAFALGGRVALADRPSGSAVYSDPKFDSVRPGRVRTYFPLTNALYIIPGQHVAHAVFRVEDPCTVRFAVVFFLEPPSHFTFCSLRLPVDDYLRITWALGFLHPDARVLPLFCRRCYRLFSSKRQRYDHDRRQPNCKATEAMQRLEDSAK
jgi:hypothetical protein